MKDPIVQEGARVLREKAKPVAKKDIGGKELNAVIKKMKGALAGENFGVAIAAPQIGKSLRIFVIAGKAFLSDEEKKGFEETDEGVDVPDDMVFINPELTRLSKKKKEMSEGCLSVRGKYGTVLRHEKASIKALDESGKPFIYHGSGLIAHIFQHECDHLDGILYIDKAVKLEEDEDLDAARQKLKDKHGI
jgi:peptide deformylase